MSILFDTTGGHIEGIFHERTVRSPSKSGRGAIPFCRSIASSGGFYLYAEFFHLSQEGRPG